MGSHFSDLTTRTMSLITMALLICFTTVLCQPLRMQAESFPCGSKNVMCERWGYDACLLRDGEHMCLPCSHEYLRSLCGTKEEVHGCNLFCLEIALAKEKEIVQTELEANFSKKTAEMESEMKNKIERSKKEKNAESNRAKVLENVIWALTATLGASAVLYLALFVWLWRTGWCCNSSRSSGNEISEIKNPLLPFVTVSGVKNTSVQAVDTIDKNVDEEQREQENITTHPDHTIINVQCPEDHCPGYKKLNSVPPSDNDTSVKVAIQRVEHELPN